MRKYYVLLMYDVAKAIKACTLCLIQQISLNFRQSTVSYVCVSFNSPLTLITKPYSILQYFEKINQFWLQQQVYRWAKRISFPLDENLLHGVLFTSCTQSISSAGLDCTPPTPHNSHTLHKIQKEKNKRQFQDVQILGNNWKRVGSVLGELKGSRRTRQVAEKIIISTSTSLSSSSPF